MCCDDVLHPYGCISDYIPLDNGMGDLNCVLQSAERTFKPAEVGRVDINVSAGGTLGHCNESLNDVTDEIEGLIYVRKNRNHASVTGTSDVIVIRQCH